MTPASDQKIKGPADYLPRDKSALSAALRFFTPGYEFTQRRVSTPRYNYVGTTPRA